MSGRCWTEVILNGVDPPKTGDVLRWHGKGGLVGAGRVTEGVDAVRPLPTSTTARPRVLVRLEILDGQPTDLMALP